MAVMMVCEGCGKTAKASCSCNMNYVPASVRAAQAIADNPGLSNRAISKKTGVNEITVRRARGATNVAGRKPSKNNGSRPRNVGSGACDFDWHNVKPSDFGGNAEVMYKKQAEHSRDEATHLAKAYPLLSKAVGTKIVTIKEIQAVHSVAAAWRDVAKQLQTKRKGE